MHRPLMEENNKHSLIAYFVGFIVFLRSPSSSYPSPTYY